MQTLIAFEFREKILRMAKFAGSKLLLSLTALSLIAGTLQTAMAVTPESKEHTKKGIALYGAGKAKEAIEEFKKAIAIDPKNADYHRNLSAVYQSQGMIAEATKEAELAVKSKPGDAKSLDALASMFLSQKKYAEAEKYSAQAVKAAPANVDYRLNHAICLKNLNKKTEFEAELKDILKKNPNNSQALVLMSKNYLDTKKTEDAEKAARAAIKSSAKDYEAHLALANVLKVRGKDKDAIAEYKTVLTMKPDHPSAKEIKETIDYINNKVDSRIP